MGHCCVLCALCSLVLLYIKGERVGHYCAGMGHSCVAGGPLLCAGWAITVCCVLCALLCCCTSKASAGLADRPSLHLLLHRQLKTWARSDTTSVLFDTFLVISLISNALVCQLHTVLFSMRSSYVAVPKEVCLQSMCLGSDLSHPSNPFAVPCSIREQSYVSCSSCLSPRDHP